LPTNGLNWSKTADQTLIIPMSAYRSFVLDSGQSQVSDISDILPFIYDVRFRAIALTSRMPETKTRT